MERRGERIFLVKDIIQGIKEQQKIWANEQIMNEAQKKKDQENLNEEEYKFFI